MRRNLLIDAIMIAIAIRYPDADCNHHHLLLPLDQGPRGLMCG